MVKRALWLANSSRMLLVGTMVLLTVICAWASDGYLSKTGPTPLRFATRNKVSPGLVLPPLIIRDVAKSNSATAKVVEVPGPTVQKVQSPVGGGINQSSTTSTNQVSTNETAFSTESIVWTAGEPEPEKAGVAGRSAGNLLSNPSQMWLEYLTPVPGATNGASATMYVPGETLFEPPLGTNRPSSQASYIVK